MEPPALPPQELTLDGVAHQGVAEAELVVVLLEQQAALHQAPQVGDQLVLGAAGHGGQHVERRMAAEHRGGLHDAAVVARQAVEVALHELGQRPRERLGAEVRGVVVARGDQDLLEEEGVAAGAVEQRVADRARDRPVVHRAEERGHLGPAEPVEAQLVDLVAPLEADEDLRGRHPAGELVGPVGAHDQQRRPGQRREALEDGQALGVGPVEVLEHDQPGCLAEPRLDGRDARRGRDRRPRGRGRGASTGPARRAARATRARPARRAPRSRPGPTRSARAATGSCRCPPRRRRARRKGGRRHLARPGGRSLGRRRSAGRPSGRGAQTAPPSSG